MHLNLFKRSLLSVVLLCFWQFVSAKEYFDPSLLQVVNGELPVTDTTEMSEGFQPAGLYRVTVKVNGEEKYTSDVRFELSHDKDLYACLTFADYKRIGVDLNKLLNHSEDNGKTKKCSAINSQVQDANATFDFSKLELNVSIPQISLIDETVNGIPEDEWDNGIPAAIIQYQASGQQQLSANGKDGNNGNNAYINLINGLNFGAWRYRNNSSISNDGGWDNATSYLERAIPALKGELTLGDASTSGDVFDSILIRGVQLGSDSDMLPEQMNGFAPVIRGIAKSNAVVTVRDNGYVIYQRQVPPGPFVINDLSSVSSGGKLIVTIKEADGSESQNTISYSSVPQLVRPGQIKYDIAIGNYNGQGQENARDSHLVQIALALGLPWELTLYGGSQYNNTFEAYNTGVGVDLHLAGGIAFDLTQSKNGVDKWSNASKGKMARLTYRNESTELGTQVEIDSRFYSGNYKSFSDFLSEDGSDIKNEKKKEINFSLNQSMFDGYSLFVSLNRSEDINSGVSRTLQAGFNGSIDSVSYSLSYDMNREESQKRWDKQISLSLTIPLDKLFASAHPTLTNTVTSSLKGDLMNNLAVTGQVGDNTGFRWNSLISYDAQPDANDTRTFSLGGDYVGNYGEAGITYNHDQSQYLSWNASGNLIGHRGGITAGQYTSSSMALVDLDGEKDVPLDASNSVETDRWGYALLPDITPYRRNKLSIDVHKVSKQLDFKSTTVDVIPTKDAIVLARFTPIVGRKVVATLKNSNGYIPFGSRVHISGNKQVFYVGEQGQVYLTATPDTGILTAKWGDNKTCKTNFTLPDMKTVHMPVTLIDMDCQSLGG